MKPIFAFISITLLLSFAFADKLTGRWETRLSEKGNVTGVVFKADNTFEGYINKKPFVSGLYTLQEDTLTFTDNGCRGMSGTYKLHFSSNADSLRFIAISDSCTERRGGMERLVLGRVKP
jgi:hypothetical protein